MILAGIDEAGYGPLLGPLVVGCCAFEVAHDPNAPDLPCLWSRLRKLVSRNRSKSGRKIHVNDSKAVYNPSLGLKELERSILAILETCEPGCGDLDTVLRAVALHAVSDLGAYPWYARSADESFPLSLDGINVKLFANALRQEMERNQARCVHLAARVVSERQLNHLFDTTRNKASALFSTAAIHIDFLLRTYGQQDLVIFCDRQGGREHYGSLLRLMFEEWALEVTSETEPRSEYRLARDGHAVRIVFCEKAEAQCMPVAVASMLSKYLREALMHRFNAWWRQHLPELEPTAGYYGDGSRFLQDIDSKRRELGITDEQLIRSR